MIDTEPVVSRGVSGVQINCDSVELFRLVPIPVVFRTYVSESGICFGAVWVDLKSALGRRFDERNELVGCNHTVIGGKTVGLGQCCQRNRAIRIEYQCPLEAFDALHQTFSRTAVCMEP